LQRQRQAQIAQQLPLTREQKLDLWKRQGLSDAELQFLAEHPAMIDYPQLTGHAASEAMQQGHQRDSKPFMEAMAVAFDNHLKHQQQQANPAEQPTPAFFEPPPPPAAPSRAHLVSAPVSREIPGGRAPDLNPRRMDLTAEETEIARASGISATQYALGKLRLQKEKASGERQ
jgi:hypothetical protein